MKCEVNYCIIVSIPDDILKQLKERQLEEIESRTVKWCKNYADRMCLN